MPMTSKSSSAAALCDRPKLLNRLPVAVIELDTDLKLRAANTRGAHLLGIGENARLEGRELTRAARAEICGPIVELCQRALKTEATASVRGLDSDGVVWDLDVNAHGRSLVVTAVDVTQRAHDAAQAQAMAQKAAERLTVSALDAQEARDREAGARAEAELRQQRLDAVFASMAEPVIVFGAEGRIEGTNRATRDLLGADLTGLSCEELGRRLEMRRLEDATLIAAQDLPAARALRGEAVISERLRVRGTQGLRTMLASSAPMTKDGHIHGAVVVFTDISTLEQTTEALQQANARLREIDQRKNEFLAALSHELRNPLAPIRNSVYISERATPGGEQAKRALSVIDRQVTHLGRIIEDLLDVTRISRGKIRLQPEVMDLNEIVRAAGEDVRGLLRDAGIAFELQVAERPVRAKVDRTRIAQVLGNLLHNALKFTARGGRIALSLHETETQAVIQIQDTGAGMEPLLIHHLFEPFVQAAQTIDRSRGGLGLGLALVKGLVDLHGGTVGAESEGPGKGSIFTVRLPLATEAKPELSGQGGPGSARRQLRILVIEDNVDAAQSLKEVLQLDDHLVDLAFDGNQGIAKGRQDVPDLVLCDIGLPGVDGYGVAKALRADPRLARTTLVALSGYALQDDVERSNDVGFDHHMSKPPDMAVLEKILAEAAGRLGG